MTVTIFLYRFQNCQISPRFPGYLKVLSLNAKFQCKTILFLIVLPKVLFRDARRID